MARPRRQDRSMVKDKATLLMSTQAQRKRWQAMATKQGMTLAAWLRYVADRAARTG